VTVITNCGEYFATASAEFLRDGVDRPGRQTWVRTQAGWRVVPAHVPWMD
jgi:hypothetical protein